MERSPRSRKVALELAVKYGAQLSISDVLDIAERFLEFLIREPKTTAIENMAVANGTAE